MGQAGITALEIAKESIGHADGAEMEKLCVGGLT